MRWLNERERRRREEERLDLYNIDARKGKDLDESTRLHIQTQLCIEGVRGELYSMDGWPRGRIYS